MAGRRLLAASSARRRVCEKRLPPTSTRNRNDAESEATPEDAPIHHSDLIRM